MSIERMPPKQYPRVEFGRRCMAFAIDFFSVWLVSSILGSSGIGIQVVQILVFIFGWLVLRVILPYNNQGQSLGRYALDIKLLEVERAKVANLQTLLKREAITCLEALFLATALGNIILNPTAIVLVVPLAIDCSLALSDTDKRQTFHDRYAQTIIVSSRRGYSLDLKVKRLFENLRRNMIK